MTQFNEVDRIIKNMSRSFFDVDGVFDGFNEEVAYDPGSSCYGYMITMGQDGKPVVKEFGNIKPGIRSDTPSDTVRDPLVDTIVDEKEKVIKLIAEMPGVEKTDVKILVDKNIVDITANHDEKKYHVRTPLEYKVDENSAKASYKNGILQLVFNIVEEKPKGKTVEVN